MNWRARVRSRQIHSVVSLMAFAFWRRSSPSVRFRSEARACGPFGCPCLAVVFPVYGVADVMAFVLDSPVAASVLVYVSGGHLSRFPAGEDQGVYLADAVAGDLGYVTADHGGLAGVREVYSLRAGDPAGPFLDLAAGVFFHDVVRGFAEQRENLAECFSLQGRLVSLDSHQVV